ncbi:MAG: T9SS type A sorting domain-containing protein, partial [Flavobacteriales bacterium]
SDLTDQAQIQFQNQWTEPMYYLDNVEVTRVNVQALDPHERHKLYVNDQTTSQSFNLPEGCWKDIDGNVLSGSIQVPPFSSRVSYQMPEDACDITTAVAEHVASSTGSSVYPNPVTRGEPVFFAPLTNGRISLTDMRGALVLNQDIPTGADKLVMPTDIASGLYVIRLQGDQRTEVQQLIIR